MKHLSDELLPTRASLLKRLRDWQDQSSWQDFFNTYWKLIYGVARKAGLTDAEAQDVVQETLVSVAKHIPTFRYNPAIGSFKAWLMNVTRWRIIGQFRKRGRLADHEPPRGSSSTGTQTTGKIADPAGDDLNDLWEVEWKKNILAAAVAKVKPRLDPEKYQIFDFYVNKEWPPEKVAQRFNVSVEQVYQIKHRITETIKAEVERLETETT